MSMSVRYSDVGMYIKPDQEVEYYKWISST